MKLLVIVPTRGRPENALRLYEQIKATAIAGTDVMFCVDDNDPMLAQYVRALPPLNLVIGEPARLGPWLNKVSTRALLSYGAVGFMGDDHMPETQGWDHRVLSALEDAGRFGIVYGDDGYQHEKLPTAAFMAYTLVAHLGWMVPPGLEHLYIDNAWKAIGEKSGGLRYLPDVKITHVHPAVTGEEMDETYLAGNSRLQYARDREAFRVFQHRVLPQIEF